MKLRGNLSKDQFDDEDLSGGLITKRIVQAVDRDRDDHHSSLEYKVIDRFLMANVGRPWDLVHSEALHKFHDPAKELRQHLRWKVDEAVYEDRHDHLVRPIGVRYGRLGTGRTAPVNGFYVHPRTGLLCHTTPTPAPPFDRLAGQIHAFLTTIKLMDYTTDFIAADWFIQLSKPTQPLVPMSVHYGDTVSVWEHRNGVWLIHLYVRKNPCDIGETRTDTAKDGTKNVVTILRIRNPHRWPEWERISTRSADHKSIPRMQADRKTRQLKAA